MDVHTHSEMRLGLTWESKEVTDLFTSKQIYVLTYGLELRHVAVTCLLSHFEAQDLKPLLLL